MFLDLSCDGSRPCDGRRPGASGGLSDIFGTEGLGVGIVVDFMLVPDFLDWFVLGIDLLDWSDIFFLL